MIRDYVGSAQFHERGVLVATNRVVRLDERGMLVATSAPIDRGVFVMTIADPLADPEKRAEPGVGQADVVRELNAAAELVRARHQAMTEAVDARNAVIVRAVDDYRLSHRQVARATGLSLGRIEGVLAND